jgi:hypothetical protein
MPEFIRFLSTLREHMNAELTRSDVLRALIWPNAGLLLALTAGMASHQPDWVMRILFAMLGIFMALYGASYIYFAFSDPDALRSEKYKLQKMAIEQGLYGDSTTGLHRLTEMTAETKLIEASPRDDQHHD